MRSRSTTHSDDSVRKAAAAAAAEASEPRLVSSKSSTKIKLSVTFHLDITKCSNLPSGEGTRERESAPRVS